MKHDAIRVGQEAAPGSLVYVVDDDPSIRGSLTTLLASVGLQVRAFETADEFLAAKKPEVPSCLILDIRLRGGSGLALQEESVRKKIRFPIVFLTGYGDIEMATKAMKAGAFDFMTKPFKDQALIDTVTAALRRDGEALQKERVAADIRDAYESLTAREREVIVLVTEGLLNKQIADQLGLSEVTVKIHRGRAMHKLQVRSVADLVKMLQRVLPSQQESE
ncbi:response regulator [Paraburkholderia sp. PGU16]|jgi:RNA polymerase sigma factor (sigma-70 family)|uniref:DNA-binding response regulator n=1 Tax=Paraburkholderia largidicola TaxID=3014751 RepID=A0A7I8BWH6_9BURK|nr:response regulator [Paraburkholderia sp. PGU16]BCF92739.1 DNA-binding response regulator [Paraburkholderia sp. PGU16]BEU25912.1 response regulator [Paraburkholderia sp. 22B1P]GJH33248.1 response regulator [Paraburkholderia hospita]